MHTERYAALFMIGLVLVLLSSGTIVTFASSEHTTSHTENDHSTTTQTTYVRTTTHTETEHESTSTATATTTTTASTSQSQPPNKESHELKYRLAGIGGQTGQGEANIQIQGTALHVNIELVHALSRTIYSIILVAIPAGSGGTSFGTSGVGGTTTGGTSGMGTTTTTSNACNNPIGQLMTGPEGNGISHIETFLTPGTYQIGIILCTGGNPAVISQPASQEGIITVVHGHEHHHDIVVLQGEATSVTPVNPGHQGNDQLTNIKHDGLLAAVINGGSYPQLSQVNSNFSAGVGSLGASGLTVSLSSSAPGSSAILVNLGNVPITSLLKGIAVTFDGVLANPVSSISQVLDSPAGQSNYVLLKTSSGLELLMSVPHLSDAIVQIMPVFSYNWVFMSLAALGSVSAIGAAVVVLGKGRLPFPAYR